MVISSAVPTQSTTSSADLRKQHRDSPALNFARHYMEMLAAMFIGMFLLGGVLSALLGAVAVDVSDWRTDAPALTVLSMAFTMSVPMVAWMRFRRHGWAAAWEMTAAMFVPSILAIAVLWSGLVEKTHALLMIEHTGMFPSMLAAMLLRRDEYARHV